MQRVADRIADWLVAHGVEQVFSVTGGGAMFLNQALGGHPKLHCTFMHHEQACAMAAEGYARIAGKPAVVMLTTGPGAINALNGVYGAYTDSIPMIVLSGQVKRETCLSFHDLPDLRQLGDQEGPTVRMAAPVCKSAEVVGSPQDIAEMLPRAFQLCTSGRPGPVWLDIPLDVQQATDDVEIPALQRADARRDGAASQQLLEQCREIARRLRAADRPLILAGTGVRLGGAQQRLIRLVEKLGVPMCTAWTHDLIASDHPLFAGRPGTIGTRAGNFCVQNADFVLVLGSRLNIRQISYNFASFAKNAWVAQVDVDPAELAKPTFAPDLGVAADACAFLDALEATLAAEPAPSFVAWADWCREAGRRFDPRLEHEQAAGAPLNPYAVVAHVFDQLRDDDIIVCGNASACILPFQVGRLRSGQRMFSNSGSASMGHDLPAALGAAQAARLEGRRKRVVCFAGDGSLQMNIQELQTLKSQQFDLAIVVLNNEGYVSISQTHKNFFGRVVGAGPGSGVEFPDYCEIARAYGIRTADIASLDDLKLLDAALRGEGPVLLNVHVDPEQEFSPRIKSRVDESGKFVTPELDDMYPFLDAQRIADVRRTAQAIRSQPREPLR
jgi:acetolactate synthase-1/2/3 large subunit